MALAMRTMMPSRFINRRFRGVRTVYPSPVTGRSASFRLRFRFVRVVRAVRAGEAKLRVCVLDVIPNAGPLECQDGRVPDQFSSNFC